MKTLALSFLLLFLFAKANADVMHGLSNHGQNKNQPYVTAGDRTYIIGTQDGMFPDLGDHVKGEMGGLWLHPIKLIDGFWAKVTDLQSRETKRLEEAAEFINYPYGNRFRYEPMLKGLQIERLQFCPDGTQGAVVQYFIMNPSEQSRLLQFEFATNADLTPVWYSKEIGIQDAADSLTWDPQHQRFHAKDNSHPWFVVWGSNTPSTSQTIGKNSVAEHTIGEGSGATAAYKITVSPRATATLTFVFAGSVANENDAVNAYDFLLQNFSSLLEKKKQHYVSLLQRARIKIPDQHLQEVYEWVKVDTEWLIREVPGIGRGLGGGLMEYPWWFGTDSSYSLQGVMATGDFDLPKQSLRLLKNQSMKKNGNGRIVHEISSNGAIPNPGNTQETAQFIIAVERLFEWSGDLDFVKEMYPMMKMGVHWLLTDMDQNKNLFPEGYGIMEVYGLNAELIDVAVYTQQALEATSRVAGVLNDPQTEKEYHRLAAELAMRINEKFWDEKEDSYCDFYGTTKQAISAAEGAIHQLNLNHKNGEERSLKLIPVYEELKRRFLKLPEMSKGWITNKNWVITTPMETGIAPREKAIRLLDKIRKEDVGEYGPYLSATDKNAMMTISTGVQAVSEMNYGRTDEALWYVQKIVQTFNRVLPGSISEMMPDYGCFTQAWTSYGIMVPLVRHIFGIQPDAFHKTILLEPHLPSGWENISIENLPVGTNVISFSRTAKEYVINSKDPDWTFILKLQSVPGATYQLNGKQVPFNPAGFRLKGNINTLLIQ